MFDFLKVNFSISDIAKWVHSIFKSPYPKKTIRIINIAKSNWWHMGAKRSKPAMQVVGDWYLTNITDVGVLICKVEISKPKTIGEIYVRHPRDNVYGNYMILPHRATEARTSFWVQPPKKEEGEKYKTTVIFTDQFGNKHRIRNIIFPSLPKKKIEKEEVQFEKISDIKNPIEKKIVSILQSEINRYITCGRRVGGLGSLRLIYKDKEYKGVGTEWRTPDTPHVQSIIPDPENAKINSDNELILKNLYNSLSGTQKKEFIKFLLKRLSRYSTYALIGYFIFYVLYKVGEIKIALKNIKEKLIGDSVFGFSNTLILIGGLLRYEYPNFSIEMLDCLEEFTQDITEPTFGIPEKIIDIRTYLISKE